MAIRKENQEAYLLNIANRCMAELDAISIPYAKGIEFSVNRRAKRRWGQCKMNVKTGKYSININEELIEPSVLMGLKETIHHELIHSCPGCMNHGITWKAHVAKVNQEYGYSIKTTNNAEEKGFSNEQIAEMEAEAIEKKSKYVFRCKECGQIVRRAKASKFTRHPEWYSCGKCGGQFEQIK